MEKLLKNETASAPATVISFFVPGDPVGKVKLTRGQQWTPAAQNYAGYKDAVQRAIQPVLIAAAIDLRETDQKKLAKGNRYTKPISVEVKSRLEVYCHFRDEHHPDPSNVLETIADAIFVNDKHICGSFDYDHDAEKVGVEVTITIPA